MRYARQTAGKHGVVDLKRGYARRDNIQFFAAVAQAEKKAKRSFAGAIGMVGGRSLPAYMVRHAQSVLRWDMLPSYWSHCFLIAGPAPVTGSTVVWESSLEPSDMPAAERNGVLVTTLERYRDAGRFPNVAVLTFELSDDDRVNLLEAAAEPNIDRTRFNMWELLGIWLPYAWRMRTGINPLTEGTRLPSAAYVEMAYERIGIDLTPGAGDRTGSPEDFWQAAKWWWRSYASINKNVHLYACVRQEQAELAQPLPLKLR